MDSLKNILQGLFCTEYYSFLLFCCSFKPCMNVCTYVRIDTCTWCIYVWPQSLKCLASCTVNTTEAFQALSKDFQYLVGWLLFVSSSFPPPPPFLCLYSDNCVAVPLYATHISVPLYISPVAVPLCVLCCTATFLVLVYVWAHRVHCQAGKWVIITGRGINCCCCYYCF